LPLIFSKTPPDDSNQRSVAAFDPILFEVQAQLLDLQTKYSQLAEFVGFSGTAGGTGGGITGGKTAKMPTAIINSGRTDAEIADGNVNGAVVPPGAHPNDHVSIGVPVVRQPGVSIAMQEIGNSGAAGGGKERLE
jgi:hypothetical protein